MKEGNIKTCKSCIHYTNAFPNHICKKKVFKIDLIDGSNLYMKCKASRSHGLLKRLWFGTCGKMGRFYEN